MTNDIVVSTGAELFMPVMEVKQAVMRRDALVGFVRDIMRRDTDFGVVPGTSTKPTLLKPGAEKLSSFFGYAPVFVSERIVENFGDDGGEPLFFYRYRCELYRAGVLVGSGIGSCNSRESKYRYRNSERVCPQCGKPAIIRSKYPPRNQPDAEPGWYCNARKSGCGANYDATDRRVTEQVQGKVPNPDVADLVNTIDKMAQKRALIAAVLIAVNASEFFTQDVEDMVVDGEYTIAPRNDAPPHPVTPTNGNGNGNGNGHAPEPATLDAKTLRHLHAVGGSLYGQDWDAKRKEIVKAATKGRTDSSKELRQAEADYLIERMEAKLQAQLDAISMADAAEIPGGEAVPA